MRPGIVIFGDSITEQSFKTGGWGASLADTYSRKAEITRYKRAIAMVLACECSDVCHPFHHGGLRVNLGMDSVVLMQRAILWGFQDLLGSKTPPVATTIFFGANDAALAGRTSERQHVPVEEYTANLRRIVNHLKECSPSMLIVLITPPPIDEEGRKEYARSLYGEKAMEQPERTNKVAGVYAKKCIELAKELGLPSIDLWSKMQETEGWQKKFLSDGLHLTAEGNAIVHKEVVIVFNHSKFSAEELPFDFPHHSEIDGKNPEKAFQHH
ncbi:hypothetical protein LguiA_009480 [Lonicera macranthoides]